MLYSVYLLGLALEVLRFVVVPLPTKKPCQGRFPHPIVCLVKSKAPHRSGKQRSPPPGKRDDDLGVLNENGTLSVSRAMRAVRDGIMQRLGEDVQRILEKRFPEDDYQPLDFMLTVMRFPKAMFDVRVDAAKAAMPFVHAKKMEAQGGDDRGKRGVIVLPGDVSPKEWEKRAKEQQERILKDERDNG